jgi:HAD superfamily hydrolase (TIGR01458 family)
MIRGVLLDLSGVVYVADEALPDAKEAIARLRDTGLPLGFVTNTTRTPKRGVVDRLQRMGLDIDDSELITPAEAARSWLVARQQTPHLLVHSALLEDFHGVEDYSGKAVVVGDAGDGFTYEALNTAFRMLTAGADFLALAKNRVFMDADQQLSLDAGPFVTALEFASQREATVIGKPSSAFYAAAVERLGCSLADTVMVGDDVEADVSGALTAGIGSAILVRTGKYQPGSEDDARPPPTAVLDDLTAAVAWILTHRQ